MRSVIVRDDGILYTFSVSLAKPMHVRPLYVHVLSTFLLIICFKELFFQQAAVISLVVYTCIYVPCFFHVGYKRKCLSVVLSPTLVPAFMSRKCWSFWLPVVGSVDNGMASCHHPLAEKPIEKKKSRKHIWCLPRLLASLYVMSVAIF